LLGEEGSSIGCCLDTEDEVLMHVLHVDVDDLKVGLEVVDVAEHVPIVDVASQVVLRKRW
jgi:hypothetical protein